MKTHRKHKAFTIIEALMSLAILGMLMAAVAVAFDASVTNFNANQGIYKTVNTGRQALLRITNDIRNAGGVALESDESGDANLQVSLGNDLDGDDIFDENFTYRFDNSTDPGILYYDDNITGNSYILCENVTTMTFNRTPDPDDSTAIRSVRVIMTITDDLGKVEQTLATASVVRKNL